MNRSALILAGVMTLLIAPVFQCVTMGWAGQDSIGTLYSAPGVQFVQYSPPLGLLDLGGCRITCTDRYSGSSTATGDRSIQNRANMDNFLCSNLCDVDISPKKNDSGSSTDK